MRRVEGKRRGEEGVVRGEMRETPNRGEINEGRGRKKEGKVEGKKGRGNVYCVYI